jgi:uncharacterized phage protein (TIGR01671 family)
MNKIRFRYYSKEYNEICEVLYIDFVNNEFCILPTAELEGGSQVVVGGLDRLEQYIGLGDKDGVELYEGDIVEADNFNPKHYIIEFIEGAFCVTHPRIQNYPIDINMFYPSNGCCIKKVGNIHQNVGLVE